MNILWDFDGTLFDTYPAYTKIVKEVIGKPVDEEEIFKNLKMSRSHAFHVFGLSEEQQMEVIRRYGEIPMDQIKPFPGVEAVLRHADKNVIMTHKTRSEVVDILEHNGMTSHFVEMVCGDDGFPRKPDPESYRFLHEKHTIHLAIGDRELDILPARQLGMKTCLFQNKMAEADYYLDNYRNFFQVTNTNS